ncbi:serine/threonine protein kinase [Minicystis rosea]|nr:serine/threonine protein kinase [Minicystis rosea]
MGESATRAEGGARARRASAVTEGAPRRCPTCGAQYPLDFLVCPKDATSLERAGDEDPLLGEVLAGSFMITGPLGEGGMGRVYEAEHVRLPRRFAVKVMLDQLASHPDAVARFEREAQAVARVKSPHVLEVVDVLRVQNRPCMVTELLEGEELGDVLDRAGKLPIGQAIAICRQVCRGLASAHAVGVVHRDLKPSNLFLLGREGGVPFVKILDFGIAKMADGAQLTRTGMVLGTPAYMAPEQARGSTSIDARADVYALGAVLYHMLTGEPPFSGGDPALTLARVLTEDPRRPRDLEKSIPDGVEALIQHAMARDPASRPGSAEELDRLLAAFDEPGAGIALVHSDRAVIASAETIAAEVTPREISSEVTRRARRARPAAVGLSIAFSVLGGASVLVIAATALRVVVGAASFSDTELILIAVLALVTTMILLLGGARVLVARWRSAPAIERLAEGLRSAVSWVLVPFAALTLAFRGYALLGPTIPRDVAGSIEIGLLAAPLLAGAAMFSLALFRARRL